MTHALKEVELRQQELSNKITLMLKTYSSSEDTTVVYFTLRAAAGVLKLCDLAQHSHKHPHLISERTRSKRHHAA